MEIISAVMETCFQNSIFHCMGLDFLACLQNLAGKWLGAKGHSYQEVNLDENPERQAEAFQLSGAMTVPVTVVTRDDDSREIIVGYNLAKLAPAVAN